MPSCVRRCCVCTKRIGASGFVKRNSGSHRTALPGNTSDYPIKNMESWSADQRAIREQVIGELQRIAATEGDTLPEIVYRAIAYIGYDLEEDAYQRLLEDMKKW